MHNPVSRAFMSRSILDMDLLCHRMYVFVLLPLHSEPVVALLRWSFAEPYHYATQTYTHAGQERLEQVMVRL